MKRKLDVVDLTNSEDDESSPPPPPPKKKHKSDYMVCFFDHVQSVKMSRAPPRDMPTSTDRKKLIEDHILRDKEALVIEFQGIDALWTQPLLPNALSACYSRADSAYVFGGTSLAPQGEVNYVQQRVDLFQTYLVYSPKAMYPPTGDDVRRFVQYLEKNLCSVIVASNEEWMSFSTNRAFGVEYRVAQHFLHSKAAVPVNKAEGKTNIDAFKKRMIEDEISCILPPANGSGGLYISGKKPSRNVQELNRLGIRAIVSVGSSYSDQEKLALNMSPSPTYSFLHASSIQDNVDDDNAWRAFLPIVIVFISRAVVDAGQSCLVHCGAGISRSATVVMAYLQQRLNMTPWQAYVHTSYCRSVARPYVGFLHMLQDLPAYLAPTNPLYTTMVAPDARLFLEIGAIRRATLDIRMHGLQNKVLSLFHGPVGSSSKVINVEQNNKAFRMNVCFTTDPLLSKVWTCSTARAASFVEEQKTLPLFSGGTPFQPEEQWMAMGRAEASGHGQGQGQCTFCAKKMPSQEMVFPSLLLHHPTLVKIAELPRHVSHVQTRANNGGAAFSKIPGNALAQVSVLESYSLCGSKECLQLYRSLKRVPTLAYPKENKIEFVKSNLGDLIVKHTRLCTKCDRTFALEHFSSHRKTCVV